MLVVYDGECGFCRANVGLLQSLPKGDSIEFVTSQSGVAQGRHPEVDWSTLSRELYALAPDGRVGRGPMAVGLILDHLGGAAKLAARAMDWGPVMRGAEAAYSVVAENRHRLPGVGPKNEGDAG